MSHPRDRFLTVYGRKPVLEALEQADVQVEKVLLAHNARGGLVPDIERAAKRAGVPLTRVPPDQVTRLSRNQRQDQGAVADVRAPRMSACCCAQARRPGWTASSCRARAAPRWGRW
jgi:23S rRNA (guanosine2251-2'-O)-methyltransferase